jgi:hypothetical protein
MCFRVITAASLVHRKAHRYSLRASHHYTTRMNGVYAHKTFEPSSVMIYNLLINFTKCANTIVSQAALPTAGSP